jgi:anthranilate phosphoribosyltransferase
MGVYSGRLVPLVAEAMAVLGVRHAMVVHGDGGGNGRQGQDELALSGPSEVAEVRDGAVRRYGVAPEDFGMRRAPLEALTGGDAAMNAAILTAIFAGEAGPRRDVTVLNAAAVLVTAGVAEDVRAGIARAEQAIDSGAVTKLVAALR